MKDGRIVVRVLNNALMEVARAEIPLRGDLAVNANSTCPFRIEAYVETHEWIADTIAPYWTTSDD